MAILKNTALTNTDSLTLPSGTTAQRPTAIYSIPGSYTWTCPAGVTSVDVLVVAGGGAGGNNLGGGGGAGGVVYETSRAVTPGVGYTVLVGAGGQNTTQGDQNGVRGTNGGNSQFDTITAYGGGGAGAGTTNTTGNNGGSGGGGSGYSGAAGGTATQGVNGTARYGSAGGAGGGGGPSYPGGGGGGANGAGVQPANSSSNGGNGGAGINIPTFGRWYWGGGGGGAIYGGPATKGGDGGAGGGGGGGSGGTSGSPASDGSGSGDNSRPSNSTTLARAGNTATMSAFTRGIGLGVDGGYNQYYIGQPATYTPAYSYVSGGHGGECTGGGGGGGTHQGWVGGSGGNGYVLIKWCNAGAIRHNSDYQCVEMFDGAIWKTLDRSQIAWSTGAEIKKIDNDVVHIWTSAGLHNFYPQYTTDIRLLVVGGGGSGGTSSSNCSAGGGGGGGVIERTHSVIGGNSYEIKVGEGALGGAPGGDGVDNSYLGKKGVDSYFACASIRNPVVAIGGGGGGGGQSRVNGQYGGGGGGSAHPSGVAGLGLQIGSPFNGGIDSDTTANGGTNNNSGPTWGGACSGNTYQAGIGGVGGGGSSWNVRQGSHGTHNTGGGGGAGSYNGGGYTSGDGGTGIVVVRYPSRIVTIGNSSSNPARSAAQIKAYNPEARSGLYWITNGSVTQQIYCDMEYDGGGWMLVASNDARDTTIPGGTGRHNQAYELDRPSIALPAAGNALYLSIIDPNMDYIIGGIINTLPFTQVRVWAWGGGSIDSSTRWPDNLGVWFKAVWGLTTTGSSRLSEVRARRYVAMTGSCYGDNITRNGYIGTRVISQYAQHFVLDGIKADRLNGGYTANSNQTTIGGCGVQDASGDPSLGAYMGHGSTEGSYEGAYHGYDQSFDTQGYTTWVR